MLSSYPHHTHTHTHTHTHACTHALPPPPPQTKKGLADPKSSAVYNYALIKTTLRSRNDHNFLRRHYSHRQRKLISVATQLVLSQTRMGDGQTCKHWFGVAWHVISTEAVWIEDYILTSPIDSSQTGFCSCKQKKTEKERGNYARHAKTVLRTIWHLNRHHTRNCSS